MTEHTKQVSYETGRDILDRHGLIVYLLYYGTEFASRLSISHHLRALPRRRRWQVAFDSITDTVQPWWQDIVSLMMLLLLTPLAIGAARYPNRFVSLLACWLSIYLLFDAILYHVRVLWFDDLRPGITDTRRNVSSHRRILFIAGLSFIQSILLFPSLYLHTRELHNISQTELFKRSFSTAMLISLSDQVTATDVIQVSVSVLYLVIGISVMASLAYRRNEQKTENTKY